MSLRCKIGVHDWAYAMWSGYTGPLAFMTTTTAHHRQCQRCRRVEHKGDQRETLTANQFWPSGR